jgi:ribonucleoside-triphosphate reductase
MAKCGRECEVYSRVCGYFRPVANWNRGKKQEFKDRKNFVIPPSIKSRSDHTARFADHEVTTKPASQEGE